MWAVENNLKVETKEIIYYKRVVKHLYLMLQNRPTLQKGSKEIIKYDTRSRRFNWFIFEKTKIVLFNRDISLRSNFFMHYYHATLVKNVGHSA